MSTDRTPRTRLALGALSGLLAGAIAVAIAELVSALVDGVTSPLFSVANRAVDEAPRPVKEFAIETFGTADKPILIGSVIAGVAVLAMVAGALGVRRPRLAAGIFIGLVVVSAAAALADRSAAAGPLLRLVPVLVMLVVGLAALLFLLSLLRAPAPRVVERALPARVSGDDLPSSFDRRKFLVAAAAVSA
ncbi:MAG: hypothetical protein Q8Q02_12235, partial [Nocardioides sp.]|nr:hypothetical protein [Nocardioides sp.]